MYRSSWLGDRPPKKKQIAKTWGCAGGGGGGMVTSKIEPCIIVLVFSGVGGFHISRDCSLSRFVCPPAFVPVTIVILCLARLHENHLLILNALIISLSRKSGSRKTVSIMTPYLLIICNLRKGHFVFKLIVQTLTAWNSVSLIDKVCFTRSAML